MIQLYTIGFTKKTAEYFFETLKKAEVLRVIDVRLNNRSQLAGFAKSSDLAYFLDRLCSIEYIHDPSLAPSEDLLKSYKKKIISWNKYEKDYMQLLRESEVEKNYTQETLHRACFLCSEESPEFCHRRLAAAYFKPLLVDVNLIHL